MNTKILTLLGVDLYEISENFIHELRQKQHNENKIFEFLPEYTINTNPKQNNQPVQANWFHQFVGCVESRENIKYLYFKLNTLDAALYNEMSNAGDDLFKDFDFKQILSVFTPEPEENLMKFSTPITNYLVVEIEYISSYYDGAYECDINISIPAYLDSDMQIHKF
jgi:hypothetical protein